MTVVVDNSAFGVVSEDGDVIVTVIDAVVSEGIGMHGGQQRSIFLSRSNPEGHSSSHIS